MRERTRSFQITILIIVSLFIATPWMFKSMASGPYEDEIVTGLGSIVAFIVLAPFGFILGLIFGKLDHEHIAGGIIAGVALGIIAGGISCFAAVIS